MQGTEAIRAALTSTKEILNWYLGDLSDADLLVRPAPGANHIAWQLGHLISAEASFLKQIPGAAPPELPAGFDKQHAKEMATSDTAKGFRKKQEYLDLFEKVRGSTLAALDGIPDAQLDTPTTGPMAKFFPTVGSLFLLAANHELMHAGQVAVLRRKLGKPILI
jgi:uncharacterized damage-inducible protein DinB